ncbi:MAG: 2-C-methyl-D-erythritol 4-phosphate cytidylyltransferase, partial [Comamonadaceae bacterium]
MARKCRVCQHGKGYAADPCSHYFLSIANTLNNSMTNLVDVSEYRACHGIILAGGCGARFGHARPKQLLELSDNSVLGHTLRKFNLSPAIDKIIVVAHKDHLEEVTAICRSAISDKPYVITPGGANRNRSVEAAVRWLPPGRSKVIIHDAVRPFATLDLIGRVAHALDSADAVIPVIESVDPIVEAHLGHVTGFIDRRTTFRGQSPQGFWSTDIRLALDSQPGDVVDRTSTVYELLTTAQPALQIVTVPGEINNIKITVPVDELIATELFRLEQDCGHVTPRMPP